MQRCTAKVVFAVSLQNIAEFYIHSLDVTLDTNAYLVKHNKNVGEDVAWKLAGAHLESIVKYPSLYF